MDQRGMSNSTQFALLMPLAVAAFLLVLQWAMLAWAQSTVAAAAQEAAMTGAAYDATTWPARSAALAATGNGSVGEVRVQVEMGEQIWVRVQAVANTPIPLGHNVSAEASMPVERIS